MSIGRKYKCAPKRHDSLPANHNHAETLARELKEDPMRSAVEHLTYMKGDLTPHPDSPFRALFETPPMFRSKNQGDVSWNVPPDPPGAWAKGCQWYGDPAKCPPGRVQGVDEQYEGHVERLRQGQRAYQARVRAAKKEGDR